MSSAPACSSPAHSGRESVFSCRRRAANQLIVFTDGDTPAWFANQETTVRWILCPSGLPRDLESRSTLLCQQMQSGKTGTYLLYALTMLLTDDPDDEKLVDNVVILSAFSDNNLKAQIETDRDDLITRLALSDRKKDRLREQIKVYHLGDLPRNGKGRGAIGPNTLVIHDECHVGQSEKQTIEACFSEAGIEKVFLGDCSQLAEKNMWYLAVSATPFSELVANEQFNQQKTVVMGETSDEYIGVGKLIKRRHVEYYDVRERGEFLRAKIDQHGRGEPGWIIIRAANRSSAGRNSAYDDAIASAAAAGLPVKEHNCQVSEAKRREWYTREDLDAGVDNTAPGVVPTSNFLEKPPLSGMTTVVIIAGAFRMGANLPKTHIKAVIDTTVNSACDTVLQGLLGRACGHWEPGSEFRVYLSQSTRTAVENYARAFSQAADPPAPERMLDGTAMNVTAGSIKAGMSFTTDTGVVYLQSRDGKAYRSFPPIKIEASLWRAQLDAHDDGGDLSAIHNIIGQTAIGGDSLQIVQKYHAKTLHSSNGLEWDSHAVIRLIRNAGKPRENFLNSGLTPKKHDLSCPSYKDADVSSQLAIASEEGKNFLYDKTNHVTEHDTTEIGDISLLLFHDPGSGVRYLTGAYRMVADWADVKKKQARRQSVAERANCHPAKSTEEGPIADSGGQQCPIGEEQLRDMESFLSFVKASMAASLTSRGGHLPNTIISDFTIINPTLWAKGMSQAQFEDQLTGEVSGIPPPPLEDRVDGDRCYRLTVCGARTLKFERKFSVGDTVRKLNGTDIGQTGIIDVIDRHMGKVQVTRNTPGRKWNKQSEAKFELVESRVWAYKSISWERTEE
tara:strand:- start:3521 stop:6055 length:2535 start_codon:yes stop_codon:yes gene_type:complete